VHWVAQGYKLPGIYSVHRKRTVVHSCAVIVLGNTSHHATVNVVQN